MQLETYQNPMLFLTLVMSQQVLLTWSCCCGNSESLSSLTTKKEIHTITLYMQAFTIMYLLYGGDLVMYLHGNCFLVVYSDRGVCNKLEI